MFLASPVLMLRGPVGMVGFHTAPGLERAGLGALGAGAMAGDIGAELPPIELGAPGDFQGGEGSEDGPPIVSWLVLVARAFPLEYMPEGLLYAAGAPLFCTGENG